MTLVSLLKLGIIVAFVSPLVATLWRKLRQPMEGLSAQQQRLRPFWRLQAAGYALAGVGVLALYALLVVSPSLNPPFWVVYAVVILVGGGALLAVHAAVLEKQSAASPATDRPQRLTRSARYDIACKLTLIGAFATFFAALSVTSFHRYAGLEQPMLAVSYTLMGLAFVFAVLSGWTRR